MMLHAIPQRYAVCQLPSMEGIRWNEPYVFVSKTDDELSLVCQEESIPANALQVERGWRMLKIQGVLDFSMVGVIAHISAALAKSCVSVFVVSTFNTDYILIKEDAFARAIDCLRATGYTVET